MSTINLVSVSGGKDSTALALYAIEQNVENLEFVFSDTGNEAQVTYDYIDYLDKELYNRSGKHIVRLKADFSALIKKRQERLLNKGETERAKYMVSSGNPFLDLCLVKGRFPSPMARFCTQELKVEVSKQYINSFLDRGITVFNWSGIRHEESFKRSSAVETELFFLNADTGAECWHYRPLLTWSTEDVFDYIHKHGLKHNPLYDAGFTRVGCFPCIMARKSEIKLIAERFPEEINRLRNWEELVSKSSKRGSYTFFKPKDGRVGIDATVEWSKTGRGVK